MKVIKHTLITLAVLISAFVDANCHEAIRDEYRQRFDEGVGQVITALLTNSHGDEMLRAYQNIVIAELNLITWGCVKPSDPNLLLRHSRIKNLMQVNAAAFNVFAAKAKKELGINVKDIEPLFNLSLLPNSSKELQ